MPFGGKKKGADNGIDGLIYFLISTTRGKVLTEKIIVSVKGGENVNVSMIRDLPHVVAREKARMGLFITLTEPTDPMHKEAIREGYCETSSGGKFLKFRSPPLPICLTARSPICHQRNPSASPRRHQSHTKGKLL